MQCAYLREYVNDIYIPLINEQPTVIYYSCLILGAAIDKEYFVAFNDVDSQWKVRLLTSERIGKLLRITGQVVTTHPVHPELVLGTFKCADCQTIISDVEQQFKYTQVFWYFFILFFRYC